MTYLQLLPAVDVADERGGDSLTMRAIADRLGVQAMSLYNHVESKDDILEAIGKKEQVEIDEADVEKRLADIADILALGLIRLHARQSTPISAHCGDSSLDCERCQSSHANALSDGGGH